MGYHMIEPADLDASPGRPSTKRPIGDAASLQRLAINLYEVAPGEEIPLAYHYHDEQEEAFYVLEGTLAVETPDGGYDVEAGQAFVAEPESPHRAYNPAEADASVRALAVGAPSIDDVHEYDP